MNIKILLLFLINLILIIYVKSELGKETVVDLLWSSQRYRLLTWGITLSIFYNKNLMNEKDLLFTYNTFDKFSNDQLREFIKEIIHNNPLNPEIDSLNKNPELLDKLSIDYGVKEILNKSDKKYGANYEEQKKSILHPLLIYKIEKLNREELINIAKKVDKHVKRDRLYLASGVLSSLDKMTETEIKNWIFKKISQHPDINDLSILDN